MDPFSLKIKEINDKLALLQREASNDHLKAPFEEAMEQLLAAMEELNVAEEELRQQHEELFIARDALEMERRRYHDLFEFAPEPYLITDMYGIVRQANQAALQRFLIPGKKLQNIPLSNRIDKQDRRAFRVFIAHLADEETPQEIELRFEAGFSQTARVQKQRDNGGKAVSLLWLMRDITARQMALQASEERYRFMVNSIKDYAIIWINPDGMIADWNPGAEHILGYEIEEVLGRSVSITFTPEDITRHEHIKEIRKAAREGHSENERWHVRKDRSRFWGSGILMALPNHEVNGYVKFMRDRTEDKRAEEQRAKNRERIVEQERQAAILEERNRLAREIHDTLAQGFTGIAIQLEAAEDSLTDSPESAKAHLLKARALARWSLNEARRSVQALRPEGLYGGSLVSALQHLVEYAALDNATIVQFVTEGTPFTLPSDVEINLLRISQEALTNTLKHAQASHITVELIFEGKTVCLSVKDDGKGFAPHVPLSSEGYGITGMRERADRIGGKFKLISKPGEGTTVEVKATIDSFPSPPRLGAKLDE